MKNIIGKKFGRLIVLRVDHKVQNYANNGTKNGNKYYFLCKCDCGRYTVVRDAHLKSGKILSCGCLLKEKRVESNIKHNLSNSRIYKIWEKMKERCYNPNSIRFERYGKRGIKVCDEWSNDFKAFYDWAINNGYKESLSIDRINNNGDYCPENCSWVVKSQQARNTSKNHLISFNGETHCIAEWAEKYNIDYFVLYSRLFKLNWSIEKALTT